MKRNGKIIQDDPALTEILPVGFYLSLLIAIIVAIIYVFTIYGERNDNVLTKPAYTHTEIYTLKILTMESPIIVDMGNGVIMSDTLGKIIEHSIKEHWDNTIKEELNRIPD